MTCRLGVGGRHHHRHARLAVDRHSAALHLVDDLSRDPAGPQVRHRDLRLTAVSVGRHHHGVAVYLVRILLVRILYVVGHERAVPRRSHPQTVGVDDTGAVEQDKSALRVDHVLLAVNDLADAAVVLNDRHGLGSAEGGHHPQWGTANRIIPVGDAYLELIAVVDPERARRSAFGRWVGSARPGIVQPLGWAVRALDIDDVGRRLDLPIASGSRATSDGRVLQWRLAGVERAAADPALPFFIEWGRQTAHPSQTLVAHNEEPVELRRVELRGDGDRLASWLGDHDLPVLIRRGPSSLTRIILTVAGREIAIDAIDP